MARSKPDSLPRRAFCATEIAGTDAVATAKPSTNASRPNVLTVTVHPKSNAAIDLVAKLYRAKALSRLVIFGCGNWSLGQAHDTQYSQ
jgi:hypothetical protein